MDYRSYSNPIIMELTKNQEDFFKQAILKSVNDSDLPLPNGLETGKVYKSEYYKYNMRGLRDIRFFIKKDKASNLYLDYYFKTDDYSIHKRINHLGETVELENFEGQFGWPVFEDEEQTKKEHQRIKEHNQKVYDILKQKGFETI